MEFCQEVQLEARDRTTRCEFSEKAIMLCKAAKMGDLDTYRRIVAAKTPKEAKFLGRCVQNFDPHLWDQVVCFVAFQVVYQRHFRHASACHQAARMARCAARRCNKAWPRPQAVRIEIHGGYTGAMHDQQIKVRTYVTVAFQIIASLPQPLFTKQGN